MIFFARPAGRRILAFVSQVTDAAGKLFTARNEKQMLCRPKYAASP
jgi:hypothetical protein